MSTKIHEAYRLKPKDLQAFLKDAFSRGVENVSKQMAEEYRHRFQFLKDHPEDLPAFREASGYAEFGITTNSVLAMSDYLRAKATQKGGMRYYYEAYAALFLWQDGNYFYVLPRASVLFQKALEFLKEDPRLTDYSYWNNTDEPEGMDPREWTRRGKVWGRILAQAGWEQRLVLTIADEDTRYLWDPVWVEKFRKPLSKLVKELFPIQPKE